MRHLRSFTVTLILLLAIPLHALAGTVASGGGGFGGGGGGDASLAEQQAQTGLLTTIDTDTGNIATNTSNTASGVGATADAAATAGSTGSLSAKLRLLTSQIDTLNTAISTLSGKLPSAASMAEDTATPSVSKIQTFPMVHDGTNWDFMGKAAAESTGVQIVRPLEDLNKVTP